MGGNGSGGARVGTGPKGQGAEERWLGGDAGKRGGGKARPPAKPFPILDPPDGLPDNQREVWLELAPQAATQRTLMAATAFAFRDLCEAVVMRRALLKRIEEDGYVQFKHTIDGNGEEHVEKKAHPLLARWQALMVRVEAGLTRFRLAPIGKELGASEQSEDPFNEFDEQPTAH